MVEVSRDRRERENGRKSEYIAHIAKMMKHMFAGR